MGVQPDPHILLPQSSATPRSPAYLLLPKVHIPLKLLSLAAQARASTQNGYILATARVMVILVTACNGYYNHWLG
jgi:hypothetical protein